MLRTTAGAGSVFSQGLGSVKVERVVSPWIEEGEEDGIDCEVSLSLGATPDLIMSEYFAKLGEIPIPPYFNRDAVPEDEVRYQNVFSKDEGR